MLRKVSGSYLVSSSSPLLPLPGGSRGITHYRCRQIFVISEETSMMGKSRKGGKTLQGIVSPPKDVLNFLGDLGLTREEASESAVKAMEYWDHTMGTSPDLSAKMISATLMYLANNRVPVRELRRMILRFPALLLASVEQDLDPRVRSLRELKIDGLSLAKVISTHPQILLEGNLDSMTEVVEIFRNLGIHENHVHKLIREYPKLLTQSSKDIQRDISTLSKLFSSGEDLLLFMTLQPSLIQESTTRFEAVWEILKEVDMSKEDAIQCIQKRPTLLLKDPKRMKESLDWFLNSELTLQEVKQVFLSYPVLLLRNVHFLNQKRKFLVKVAGRPFRDILQYPNYLSFSIDRVIGPRFAFLKSRNDPVLQTASLLLLVTLNNSDFATRIAKVLEAEYLVYQAQWTRMYGHKLDSAIRQKQRR